MTAQNYDALVPLTDKAFAEIAEHIAFADMHTDTRRYLRWLVERARTLERRTTPSTTTDAPCPPGDAAAHVPLSVSSNTPAGVNRVAPSDAEASGLPSGAPDLETVLLPKLAELEMAMHGYITKAFQLGVLSRDGEVAALRHTLMVQHVAASPLIEAALTWESMIEENATDGIILAQNELQDAVRAYRGKAPIK